MDVSMHDLNGLVEILGLLKRRDVNIIKRAECREVLPATNRLLKKGLLTDILKSIKTDVVEFCKKEETTAAAQSEDLLHVIRTKADIVFFAAYQTQFEESEANLLKETIKFISDHLLTVGSQQQVTSGADWCPPVFSLLVVLQLAHVAALQQTTCLLSRHVDYCQPMYQQCKTIEDVIEVGNSLPQTPGSRCGMDSSDRALAAAADKDWLCDGAKGFACLALAVLRQPEVDVDHAPASDVEWFLHEACRLRAYSYVRLCMLPVLQAAYLQDKETALFYVAVLCELMENLAKIFCMTHYKQVHAHNESDFPYLFFPPTGDFYADNMAFYANRLKANAGQKIEPAAAVDSLEDVLSVFTALLDLRPEFAHSFWPSTQSHDIEVQQRHAQRSMQDTSDHHDIVDHYYHPFVMKAVDASFHHPELMICAIRFVAALSNSPLGRTAYAGYLLVLDSSHHRFSWAHFFESMDTIALQLGASLSVNSAPGAGMGGLSSYSQQAQQQTQLVAHHFSLTEKDAEGLVAIMRLIATVSVHPAVAALLHESYRPLPRLFALLSCALPITLKGAILRTLSVFARGSAVVSEEIWGLVEAHRLLPITAAAYGTAPVGQQSAQGSAFGSRRAGAPGRGLRVELEEAETRAGRYPVTEGFLQLLEALLSHGTPDTLGRGYRRPGLMVYLDYVVDDVLMRTQDRPYQPSDWPSARAQRWRICTHCLSILRTILQNYPVNAIPASSFSAAEQALVRLQSSDASRASALKEVLADFRDSQEEYLLEGSSTPQRASRPKTAAFMVMAMLLGRARLFDYLGYLLLECSAHNLELGFNEHCLSEVGAAVDLVQKVYELGHHSSAPRHEASFDFSFPMSAASVGLRGAASQLPVEEAEPLDLTSLGRETHLCDLFFWQERTVAGVVGLLYECALREERFMALYRSCGGKVTITRISEQGRAAVLPVILHDLSELLCVDRESGMLSLIAQVVPLHIRSCPCLPAANVLCIRIIEHVALHMPAGRLLAALMPTTGQADRAGHLIEGCAAAIRADVSLAEEQNDGSLHYDVVCLGGVPYPSFCSLSAAYTSNLAPPNLYLTMINADSNEEAAQVDAEYLRALRLGGTIREAVLSLLLRTLTPTGVCLSHQLLGLGASTSRVFSDPSATQSFRAPGASSRVLPEGCLDAVLYVLSPSSTPVGTTAVQLHPEQAETCFELVYRLAASPATSDAVLRRLADRQVDHLRVQLTLLVYLLHLSDDELLEGVDLTAELSNGVHNNNNISGLNESVAALQSVKASLHSCAAWLVKTCTLSLRHAELHRSSALTAHASSVLELLFSSCSSLPFGQERGDHVSVLEKLLGSVTAFPVHPYAQTARPTAAMLQHLEAAAFEQRLGRAGAGWGEGNQFLRQDAAHASALTYRVVDLRALTARVAASSGAVMAGDLQGALNVAVQLNIYNKVVATQAHLSAGWCQLVNMLLAGGKTQELLRSVLCGAERSTTQSVGASERFALSAPRSAASLTDEESSAQKLVEVVDECLFAPTTTVLASRAAAQHPLLPDLFARCMLAQVKVLVSSSAALSVERYTRVLERVVQLILQPRDWALSGSLPGGDSSSTAASAAYRGMLSTALLLAIQAPSTMPQWSAVADCAEGVAERKSQGQEEEKEALVLARGECAEAAKGLLEQCGAHLVDTLSADFHANSSSGAAVWRLSSLSALTALLAALSDHIYSGAADSATTTYAGKVLTGEVYGSHAFVQALQVLVQRGHLQAMLSAGLDDTAPTASAKDSDATMLSVLSLSVQIASSIEGAEALLACDVMSRLVALNHFASPPPFPDEIAFFGSEALQSREEAVAELQARFLLVTNLMRCLFAAAPKSHVVARGVALFLSKNQALVTQLLRMRYLSLGGMAMTEAAVSALAMLAAVPTSALRPALSASWSEAGTAQGQMEGSEDPLFAGLGSCAESFIADASTLLSALGQSPVPSSLAGGSARLVAEGGWWERIQPSAGYEAEWDRTQAPAAAAGDMPADWTVFDDRKLQLSLQVVSHCAAFLRLVTSPQRTGTAAWELRAVNAFAIVEAFCQCAALSQQLMASAASSTSSSASAATGSRHEPIVDRAAFLLGSPVGAKAGDAALNWLQSPLPIQAPAEGCSDESAVEGSARREAGEALLRIAEGLICTVHNCALLSGGGQASTAASLPTERLQRVLDVAETFPSHSLIRQVARWIRDLMLQ